MRILTYRHLDTTGVEPIYEKVRASLSRGDFTSADVKKLTGTPYYRAKLNDTHRLLLTFRRIEGETACLLLEVIPFHRYEKSRFLRGARWREEDMVAPDTTPEELRYVHPTRATFHVLDKPISFNDEQEDLYLRPLPVMLLGSAGSGKTVLALEKLRALPGDVLYVTLSPPLARQAEALYTKGGRPEGQNATFLALSELLDTLRVDGSTALTFNAFQVWFGRVRPRPDFTDAHALYEEIRGVITSDPDGPLSRDAYRALGVRQSLFPVHLRDAAYGLYEHATQWMKAQNLTDPNQAAHARLGLAEASYDALIADEVQDMTPVQLALLLRLLRKPDAFLLCGDAHQVVHPNFFSWAAVRHLFWTHDQQQIAPSVLSSNFRNARAITRVANRILTLKQLRFGSVDRDSTTLTAPTSTAEGEVSILPRTTENLHTLNDAIRRDAGVAVIVLRDEDKAAARAELHTPLIFSVQEIKGLEYDSVILHNLIGSQRATYAHIAGSVEPSALDLSDLPYLRAGDKQDKSLDQAKFYVNALYVALTRAVQRVILVEDDTTHPLLNLLDVAHTAGIQTRVSSTQEWVSEARRLQSQGKTEQASAILEGVTRPPVPWDVMTPAKNYELHTNVRYGLDMNSHRQQRLVFEHALWLQNAVPIQLLYRDLGFGPAKKPSQFAQNRVSARLELLDRETAEHRRKNTKWVHHACDTYGTEHPNRFGATPLTLAALAGNAPLVRELLHRGADLNATDPAGFTSVMHALGRAAVDLTYRRGSFADVFDLTAPPHIDVRIEARLVRISRTQGEYHVLLRMLARLQSLCFSSDHTPTGFTAADLTFHDLPDHAPAELRQTESAISDILARAEVDHPDAGEMRLWQRMTDHTFMPNPELVLLTAHDPPTWKSLFDAQSLLYAQLPDAYFEETPIPRVGRTADQLPDGPLNRVNIEAEDDSVGVPQGLVDRYVMKGTALGLMILLLEQSTATRPDTIQGRWGDPSRRHVIYRIVRRLCRVRLIVRDDSGDLHGLLNDHTTVFAGGRLQTLSDAALNVLLAWHHWLPVHGASAAALEELRAAGFTAVLNEALRGDPLPDDLRSDMSQNMETIITGPDPRKMHADIIQALRRTRAAGQGETVFVQFSDYTYFKFKPGETPGSLYAEISRTPDFDNSFTPDAAFRARVAASDWTLDDDFVTRLWTDTPVEDVVEETMNLTFDLYGLADTPAGIMIIPQDFF